VSSFRLHSSSDLLGRNTSHAPPRPNLIYALWKNLTLNYCSLSEARQKREEYAANIEKFLNLIKILNDHKAELTTKVETLTIEKSTMEREMEDCLTKIEQLRLTIDGQELSQEDVRRMEREKARIEEQIARQGSILKGLVAALKEEKEALDGLSRIADPAQEPSQEDVQRMEGEKDDDDGDVQGITNSQRLVIAMEKVRQFLHLWSCILSTYCFTFVYLLSFISVWSCAPSRQMRAYEM
jgi:hypothetical protein